jgi:hypothetical protein
MMKRICDFMAPILLALLVLSLVVLSGQWVPFDASPQRGELRDGGPAR